MLAIHTPIRPVPKIPATLLCKSKPSNPDNAKLLSLTFENYKTTYYVGETFDPKVDVTVNYKNKDSPQEHTKENNEFIFE